MSNLCRKAEKFFEATDLIIDHTPGVRNSAVEFPSKGVVAGARGRKRIAHHLGVAKAVGSELLGVCHTCPGSQ